MYDVTHAESRRLEAMLAGLGLELVAWRTDEHAHHALAVVRPARGAEAAAVDSARKSGIVSRADA